MNNKQNYGCSGDCLTADMRITMSDGSTKPISAVRLGESILDGQRDVALVGYVTWGSESAVVCLTLENGGILKATPNHPILTPNGFKRMGDLRPGDQLQGLNGTQTVKSTIVTAYNDRVFNLALERSSTMLCEGIIVGDAGTQSALSH